MENIFTPESEINLPSDYKVNLKNEKIKIIIISIILFSFLIIFTLLLIQKIKLSKTNSNISTTEDNQIESGWVKYQNDVLGIKFIYPESWGEVSTSPSNNITHLSSINKDYLDSENNDLRYMIKLTFSKQYTIKFDFINNLFPGNHEFDADSFQNLLNTGNICQYNINSKTYGESYSEKYNECKNNIKCTLIFYDPSRDYYSYSIKQFFYKKLNNNYFNNLLIKNSITSYQGSESNLNFNQILQKDKNQEADEQLMSDFKKMVKSIEVFSPPIPTQIVFQENQSEDSNIITIRKYYYLLATQKLSEAYDMYQNKNISFEEFSDYYNKVFYTNVYNIELISLNKYQFNVDIQEINNQISKYLVVMEINDDRINTISSEEILSEEIKFGEYSAYTRLKSGKNEVVLVKNGIQKVIDSGSANALELVNGIDTYKTFGHVKFSSKGTYLIYNVSGWGWYSSVIYDIDKNQEINSNLWGTDIILTDDEKYLISCTSDGAGPGVSVKIYTTPEFNLKKDFQNTIDNIGMESPLFSVCSYSSEKSELNVVISNGGINGKEKIIKYNFVNGQETIQ